MSFMRYLVVLQAVVLAGCGGPNERPPLAQQENPPSRRAWWFKSDLPVGCRMDYRIAFESVARREGQSKVASGQTDIVLGVSPRRDKPGRTLHLLTVSQPSGPTTTPVTAALQWLDAANREGLFLSDREVALSDIPLVRGPWRAGDQMTFGLVFFGVTAVHADVVDAQERRAELSGTLWQSWLQGTFRSDWSLMINSDDRGITDARFEWRGRDTPDERHGWLTATRTAFRER